MHPFAEILQLGSKTICSNCGHTMGKHYTAELYCPGWNNKEKKPCFPNNPNPLTSKKFKLKND